MRQEDGWQLGPVEIAYQMARDSAKNPEPYGWPGECIIKESVDINEYRDYYFVNVGSITTAQ